MGHWINLYPADNAIVFPDTNPLDSDLPGRWIALHIGTKKALNNGSVLFKIVPPLYTSDILDIGVSRWLSMARMKMGFTLRKLDYLL